MRIFKAGLVFATFILAMAQLPFDHRNAGKSYFPELMASSITTTGAGKGTACSASVAFDAKGTANFASNSATSASFNNLTVGSGSNRALIAVMSESNSSALAETCTWDSGGTNQVMTLITAASGIGARAVIFGLVNPIAGNKTLACSYTGVAGNLFVDAISFTKVDQTGGATSFPNSTSSTGSASNTSLSITSSTRGAAVDSIGTPSSISVPGQTQIYLDNTGSLSGGAASYNLGTASPSFSWTITGGARNWVEAGTAIAPSCN